MATRILTGAVRRCSSLTAWYLDGGHLERPIDLDAFVVRQFADYMVARLASTAALHPAGPGPR